MKAVLRFNVLRALFLPIFLLAGCARTPDHYAPPPQSALLAAPVSISSFVEMADANADAYILGDVNDGLEAGSSRWTRKRPSLRFFLDTADHLRFQADFSIADSTFRDTGPVT